MKKNKEQFLGLDCGGTNIKIALVDSEGEILKSAIEPISYKQSPQKVLKNITSCVQHFMDKNCTSKIKGLGIGVAAEVDQKNGIILNATNLGWRNVPIADFFTKELGIPINVENDSHCAAWGSYCLDAKKKCSTLICLTLGTGVGGGIIIGGKLYRGPNGLAGYIGHMSISYSGRVCRCGSIGCLESMVGAWALSQTVKERCSKNSFPILRKLLRIDKQFKITPELIAEAAINGDCDCQKLWNETGKYLGIALGSLANIFNPEKIILCGGISKAGVLFLKPMLDTFKKQVFKTIFQYTEVSISKYTDKIGVVGAALLFMDVIYER
ncbi:MAG: ROK family protein [Candidatus Firestonebacteria bacterium]